MHVLMEHKQKDLVLKIYDDFASGLLYNHTRNTFNTERILEASSFLYALIELLSEKGLLSINELDERKKEVAERLIQRFTKSGIGLMCQDKEFDKYTFEHNASVDCESRLSRCKALCCKFPFALSRQDVEEGIIRWDFGRPYLIAHKEDGYCIHLDNATYRCTVYKHRPVPCKGFDCKDNEKWHVWQDYDNKIINYQLIDRITKNNGDLYASGIGG